jgi:hypothetical protein
MAETTTLYRFEIGDRIVTIPAFISVTGTIVGHAPRDKDGSLVYWVRMDGLVGVNRDGSANISKMLEWVVRPLANKPMKLPAADFGAW